MDDYRMFLAGKAQLAPSVGVDLPVDALHPHLFPWQRDVVRWALRKGRCAIFANTGLGKTLMQLVWAQHAAERALILAPLAVARQTVREGERWGIPVTYARDQAAAPATGITITNYEMSDHFDADAFGAVVLDESSILKAHDGKTRARLIAQFHEIPLRLCCTATPAPNDIAELANHAEFLGVASRVEMLATFFVHDDEGWRLKGHAKQGFYRWLASWGISLTKPSDIGYSDEGYDLPPLTIEPVVIPVDYTPSDQLFFTTLKGITDRTKVRKATIDERVRAAEELVRAEPDEPWLIWVGLNDEGHAITELIPDAVEVEGSQSVETKTRSLLGFSDGDIRVLVSKVSLSGFGMNWQHCRRMVFVGLGDSYEQYFQAIRRCWRFGQTAPVHVYIVLTEPEEAIYQNVLRKEREAAEMTAALVREVAAFESQELHSVTHRDIYRATIPMQLPRWLEVA
ncbi:MAG: hypothetical protein KC442_11915 [Thermomicrobiales bacterium]|nr:hypothetical protein [Thermomicrobiales bacterium]